MSENKSTIATVKRNVGKAVTAYKKAEGGLTSASILAAVVTREAEVSGYLALGRGTAAPGSVKKAEFADMFSVSLTRVDQFRLTGLAIEKGVPSESETAARLVRGDSTVKAVRDVIENGEASASDVIAACDALKAERDAKKAGVGPKASAAKKGADENKAGEHVAGRNNSTRMDHIETEAAALKSLTPGEKKRLLGIADALRMIAGESPVLTETGDAPVASVGNGKNKAA